MCILASDNKRNNMRNYSLTEELKGGMQELLQIDRKCEELLNIDNYRKTIEVLWLNESDLTDGRSLLKDDIEFINNTDTVFIISLN